jgi:hypothetical protein
VQPDDKGILRLTDNAFAALPTTAVNAVVGYLQTLGYKPTGVYGTGGPKEFQGPAGQRIWVPLNMLPGNAWLRWFFWRMGWTAAAPWPGK